MDGETRRATIHRVTTSWTLEATERAHAHFQLMDENAGSIMLQSLLSAQPRLTKVFLLPSRIP